MSKNNGKITSKILSSKYSSGMLAGCQEILDYAKQSATNAIKTTLKK